MSDYRRTSIGGGYELVEDESLCIIEPDPMEAMIDAYHARQDREAAIYYDALDVGAACLRSPVHDEPHMPQIGLSLRVGPSEYLA